MNNFCRLPNYFLEKKDLNSNCLLVHCEEDYLHHESAHGSYLDAIVIILLYVVISLELGLVIYRHFSFICTFMIHKCTVM